MRYICQNCGQNYEVKDSREGEVVPCQKCGKPMTLPEVQYGYKVEKQNKVVFTRPRRPLPGGYR